MANLRLGASTFSYVYTHSALDSMLHLATLGFRDFELVITPPHIWPPELDTAKRAEIPRQLAAQGLTIRSFCFPMDDNNLNSILPEIRTATVAIYEQIIDLAGEWRVPYVLLLPGKVHPFFPQPQDWMMDWLVQSMRTLAPRAADAGTQLLIENIPSAFLPRADDIMRALDHASEASIGVNLDIANARTAGEDPVAAVRRVKDRLKLVHLADNDGKGHRKEAIGRGNIDYASVANVLREIGFEGFSMLEMVTVNDPEGGHLQSREVLGRFGWA